MKHGGSVSATARQPKYCASNLEQGNGKVPAPSVLRNTKLWNYSRTAGETLERPSRSSSLDGQACRIVTMIPDAIADVLLVLFVLVRSTIVKGSLV